MQQAGGVHERQPGQIDHEDPLIGSDMVQPQLEDRLGRRIEISAGADRDRNAALLGLHRDQWRLSACSGWKSGVLSWCGQT